MNKAQAKKLAYGHAARTLENSLETREDLFDLYPDEADYLRVTSSIREVIEALYRKAD